VSKVAIIAIVVFVAELGDKSQLMALALAAKHRTRDVFLGIFLAIIVSFGVAVILGALIGEALDAHRAPIAITAGILFLAFAAWTLKGDADSDDGDMSPLSGKLGPCV
jgi:putative Ca2+/H+ antiporter (TMEM165/GDT1 family)